jgi:hypothetical protein
MERDQLPPLSTDNQTLYNNQLKKETEFPCLDITTAQPNMALTAPPLSSNSRSASFVIIFVII